MKCPCGLGPDYDDCCGRFHRGEAAPTAERLMRSRYSAFVVQDEPYLLATWHPSTRPPAIGRFRTWTGLDVLATSGGGLLDAEGTVEFEAHHGNGVLHEWSRFVKEGGRWFYVGTA